MTAAELREIGERIKATAGTNDWRHADDDRARLYAALERLIEQCIFVAGNGSWQIEGVDEDFATKDAAIDALLEQPR